MKGREGQGRLLFALGRARGWEEGALAVQGTFESGYTAAAPFSLCQFY